MLASATNAAELARPWPQASSQRNHWVEKAASRFAPSTGAASRQCARSSRPRLPRTESCLASRRDKSGHAAMSDAVTSNRKTSGSESSRNQAINAIAASAAM